MPSRRDMLQLSAAGAAFIVAPSACAAPVSTSGERSQPAPSRPQAVPVRPFKIGSLDAFAILTASFPVANLVPGLFPNAPASEVAAIQKAAFLPPNSTVLSVNVLAVKSATGLVLVDTGPAPFASGEGLGTGLAAAGFAAADVAHVLVTHAHGDHIGGLVDGAGKPAFPKAKVHIGRVEAEYWLGGKAAAQSAANVKRIFGALGDALVREDAGEIIPGFSYVEAFGHTPGHMLVEIGAGAERLVHIGDAAHVPSVQGPRPEWSPEFDVDPKRAAATRRALMGRLANERLRTMAVHFPFPAAGHFAAEGAGFRWVPEP